MTDDKTLRVKVADFKGPWHPEAVCATEGRPCVIHRPSAHHMSGWTAWLRGDTLIERECPHGLYHPDPDSLRFFTDRSQREGIRMGLHPCDGCCLGVRPEALMTFEVHD